MYIIYINIYMHLYFCLNVDILTLCYIFLLYFCNLCKYNVLLFINFGRFSFIDL